MAKDLRNQFGKDTLVASEVYPFAHLLVPLRHQVPHGGLLLQDLQEPHYLAVCPVRVPAAMTKICILKNYDINQKMTSCSAARNSLEIGHKQVMGSRGVVIPALD